MSILGAKKNVERQLKGKDPKGIAWWFLDRALVLLHESKVPKDEILAHINKVYQDIPKL